ncbi:hypothetical protein PsorP6_012179 [Peronosclerospora sorghi]|uniref:Uncharacterized protein n=1 Tax=Peronosclerospora sorghi TaxID=230839 RepID=A0ACC0WKD3_9STRA|nr:hypothetical protein PsorP6_012179 [Peronosclerospora sorghi]
MAMVQSAQQSAVLSLFLLPEMITVWVETNYQLRGRKDAKEANITEQDLDVKEIGGPGASLSKMALSKLENLPLPDLLNLPQDLSELKRKIEATEHKVEGTKHRHRKGSPCPRRQVKNQLRAATRAYHKRAVAHKKLPHVVVNAVNDEALGPDASRGKSMACFQDVDVPSIMQATDEWVPQMARKLKARIHGVNAHHNIVLFRWRKKK